MNRKSLLSVALVLFAGVTGTLGAQATGTTTFNAPYRAFSRSEIGLLLSFPNGGGTAFEGVYRMASGSFDIGFKGGLLDPGGPGSLPAPRPVSPRIPINHPGSAATPGARGE